MADLGVEGREFMMIRALVCVRNFLKPHPFLLSHVIIILFAE